MDTGKYTKEEVDEKFKEQRRLPSDNQRKIKAGRDDDVVRVQLPVDPCPSGFKLDPASEHVPVEEAEEGFVFSLNRARDTEFEELDDIMSVL